MKLVRQAARYRMAPRSAGPNNCSKHFNATPGSWCCVYRVSTERIRRGVLLTTWHALRSATSRSSFSHAANWSGMHFTSATYCALSTTVSRNHPPKLLRYSTSVAANEPQPVSYTHLTLPTSDLV